MNISYNQASQLGIGAVCAVFALQAFNGFSCYQQDVVTFLWSTPLFVGFPLLPAFAALWQRKPLGAVGACALFAPWLLMAYYEDCIRPYSGGGASMTYVAVQFYGVLSSMLGAYITKPLTRLLGIQVQPKSTDLEGK